MKILEKAARLEKAVLDRLARRGDITRHPLEVYRAILDDIEDATEPGGRGGRIFPYTAITVTIPTADGHHRATAEAVFSEAPPIEARVRARLRHAGCPDGDAPTVTLKFVDGTGDAWAGRDYRIDYRRQPTPRQVSAAARTRASTMHELHVTVLAGTASKARYTFTSARINLGRLGDVLDRHQRIVRQNQVAFADGGDDTAQSVSRAHAHVAFDAAAGDARLHDDGSTHGTRVVRGGRTLGVPRSGGRGLKLQDGDEVLLGQAKLRVELRPARKAR